MGPGSRGWLSLGRDPGRVSARPPLLEPKVAALLRVITVRLSAPSSDPVRVNEHRRVGTGTLPHLVGVRVGLGLGLGLG